MGIYFNFLKEFINNSFPIKTHRVPIKDVSKATGQYIIKHIEREKVTHLVEYAKQYNATINDVLLAAIFRALSKTGEWQPGEALRILMTIDLRRYVPDRNKLSVANFSSMEMITYGTDIERDFAAILQHVVTMMRKRKSSWLGLNSFMVCIPLLTALPAEILNRYYRKGVYYLIDKSNTCDSVTNMGEIRKEQVDFGGYPTNARLMATDYDLPSVLFGCSGYNGSLCLSTSPRFDSDNAALVDQFLALVVSELSLDGISQYEAAA